MKVEKREETVTFEMTFTGKDIEELTEEYFHMQGRCPVPRARQLLEHIIRHPDD